MRRRPVLLLAAAAFVLTPVVAAAAPLTPEQIYEPVGSYRFCAEAQLDIANIDEELMVERGISITTVIYGDTTVDFVSSKSAVDVDTDTIVTTEGIEYRDAAKTQPGTLRCKLRTGESLDKGAWPPGSGTGGIGRFAVDPYYGFGEQAEGVSTSDTDQDCSVVNQRTIDNVWANLTAEQKAAAPYTPEGAEPTIVTTPDEQAIAGPPWLIEYPPLVVDGDTLQVRSKALIVPTGSFTARFEGAHYCTFVAPEYLRDVLLGGAVSS